MKTNSYIQYGGEGGIRTPETVAGLIVFKTIAFDHSATSPRESLAKTGTAASANNII